MVLPLTTSCEPAGAALSPRVMRTSPVSCCGLKRSGMLRMNASSARAGMAIARLIRINRAACVRFMTSFPRRRFSVNPDSRM